MSSTGDYGLVQINLEQFPNVSKEEALDPIFSLRWAADRLSKGEDWLWTSCSCIQMAKALHVPIPKGYNAWDIIPNGPPAKGGLIVFSYHGVRHVAVIQSFGTEGIVVRESNYTPCKIGTRTISYSDPHIVGFWSPLHAPADVETVGKTLH